MDFNEKLFEAYESGKHRRYTLLFAVNGGAFAVVELLVDKGVTGTKALSIEEIAWGMILFTAIMCFDILAFGLKMRAKWQGGPASYWDGLFALPGWVVLGSLWLLISMGWALAGVC